MMFCSGCGAQMHSAALACPTCGKPNATLAPAEPADGGWFSFRGRISRKVYWLHYLLPLTAVGIVANVLDHLAGMTNVISGIVGLLLLAPGLACAVKRLHDRDHSGWLYLVVLIPVIGWIWMFVELGCLRGTRGPNRFGGSPLAEDRTVVPPAGAIA